MPDLTATAPAPVADDTPYQLNPAARITTLDTSCRAPMWQLAVGGRRFQINEATVRFLSELEHPAPRSELTERVRGTNINGVVNDESAAATTLTLLINLRVLVGANGQPETTRAAAPRRDGMTFRLGLVSRERLLPITSPLRWLFMRVPAILTVVAILIVHAAAIAMGVSTPDVMSSRLLSAPEYVSVMALLLASIAFHELGHLSACERYGAKHGEVGVGVFLIWPVAYANVDDCWSLTRMQRAVVDVGGIYFHAIWSAVCCVCWMLTGEPLFAVVVHLILLCTIVNLNPFLKFDGYWLLTDLTGIPSLHRGVRDASLYGLALLMGKPRRRPDVLDRHPVIVGSFAIFWVGCAVFLVYLVFKLTRFIGTFLTQVPERVLHLWQLALAGDFGWDFVQTAGGIVLFCASLFMLGNMVVRRLARFTKQTWDAMRVGLGILIASSIAVASVRAQEAEPYGQPPAAIVQALDAPAEPFVVLSPSREWVAIFTRRSMPSLREVAEPTVGLAGLRFNPLTRVPHRPSDVTGVVLVPVDGVRNERAVVLPNALSVLPMAFAPAGDRLALGVVQPDGVHLWVVNVETGVAREIDPRLRLNAIVSRRPCDWMRDGRRLACFAVPSSPATPAERSVVHAGPATQETKGSTATVRTYPDLLRNAEDDALFEFSFRSDIVLIEVDRGRTIKVGKPGLYEALTTSPDSQWMLVHRLNPPFSRLLPYSGFEKSVEVWSLPDARSVPIARVKSAEQVPINGVNLGPRLIGWDPTSPARLYWIEALDGGDPKTSVPYRDRVVTLAAPFTAGAQPLGMFAARVAGVKWTDRGIALITEFDRGKRWTRTWIAERDAATRLLWDRSAEDRFGDPGTPLMRPDDRTIIQVDDDIFLSGRGLSTEGERPFLDRLTLTTLATTRVFLSEPGVYEVVSDLLNEEGPRLLTKRESPKVAPHYVVRDLSLPREERRLRRGDDGNATLSPAMFERRVLRYRRADGIELSATLYLPPQYRPGSIVPVLLWAYPREFSTGAAAGHDLGLSNRFVPITGPSHLALLMEGYAILDNPSMPIVGPPDRANDTFVEQLVANAEAAVEALVATGIADRQRIGIGGHSFGATMVVTLLARSDLFCMGIARSGAYNRTLTPFGFQTEGRTFWQAPSTYVAMSPFWNADQIDEPLLLIHGELDNNSGTAPIQSERLFRAIQGLGGHARYISLPYEAHNYIARETVLHVVAEMVTWADRYLAQPRPRDTPGRTAVR